MILYEVASLSRAVLLAGSEPKVIVGGQADKPPFDTGRLDTGLSDMVSVIRELLVRLVTVI